MRWNVKFNRNWTAFGSALALAASVSGFMPGNGSAGRSLSSIEPRHAPGSQITRDAALYERVRQLDLKKVPEPSFEDDLSALSRQESRHHEKLPGMAGHGRLRPVVKRLSAGPYVSTHRRR
jgi:hypothetical protein